LAGRNLAGDGDDAAGRGVAGGGEEEILGFRVPVGRGGRICRHSDDGGWRSWRREREAGGEGGRSWRPPSGLGKKKSEEEGA
jgi:hypothetical protein